MLAPYEAASFAGIHNLGKLIVLYDSNNMTLDASTKNTFRDDMRARFEALGWHYELVREGTDVKEIDKAIGKAKKKVIEYISPRLREDDDIKALLEEQ